MSSNESSSVSRKRFESSSQSRLTTFFKPSPERNDAHAKKFGFNYKRVIPESPNKFSSNAKISPVKRSQEEITNNSVPNIKMRKMGFRDSPRKEDSLVNKRVIEIDLDSSDRDSNLEEELISPQKKFKPAKVAKRTLQIYSNGFSKPSKLPDHSTKKAGLAMRIILSPNKSSAVRDNIPTMRSALEEKKNLNREKRSAVTDDNVFSPVKKLKRTHPVSSSQDIVKGDRPSFKPSFVAISDSMSNSVSSQESEFLSKKLDSERKIDVAKNGKSTKSPNLSGPWKEKNVSSTRQLVSESMQQADCPDLSLKEIRVEAFKHPEKSAVEKKGTEESVVAVHFDKTVTDAQPEAANHKEAKISLQKVRPPRIVRRSAINTTLENGLAISSRITVGLEEINAGALVAFRETYKDMETLLNLELDVTICPDLKKTLKIKKFLLPNSSHVNFNFYMNRKPVEHLKALRSQQVDVHQYPRALDLHTVIHKILMNGSEHIVLHRAQELIYATLGFHPSVEPVIRKYYWSVLSQHFDDPNPCSRWEIIRELLEEVLGADDYDASNKMYIDPNKLPTKLERTRAVLGVIIQILREDLRCWITSIAQPSNSLVSPSYLATRLRERNDLPLVARILWPQTSIPHINVICRELIDFHVTALKSGNPTNLLYTEPFVKMMTIVTHMSDLELPLTVRKPEEHMMNLAREIVLYLDDLMYSINNSFCSSFGSSELELLLPLIIMNRLKPQIYPTIAEGKELNLTWMLKSYLKIDTEKSCENVVTRFRSQPTVERNAFLSALSAYFKLFGAFTTWFHMRTKYRNSHSHLSPAPDEKHSTQSVSVGIFSRTFTPSQLMDDLRRAKYLLEVRKNEEVDQKGKRDPSKKVLSLYSSISWQ